MPYTPSWLAWEAASGGRVTLAGTPTEIKSGYDALVTALAPLYPAPSLNVNVQTGDVNGIGYRLYTPKSHHLDDKALHPDSTGLLPILIWTHGGGWMTGDLDSDDLFCRGISEKMGWVVVNVDYRLTPETVWPGQLEDCVGVYRWTHANASSFSGDPKRMITGGGSAGGGLALSTAAAVVQDPSLKDSLKGVVALVPVTAHPDSIPKKYKDFYKSYEENKEGTPIIDRGSMEIFFEHAKISPSDPTAFPILATETHKHFPPVYLASCEFDPLRDDAFVMEKALKEAGVETKHDYWEGLPHYFWIFPPVSEGKEFVEKVFEGMEWLKGMM